MSQRLFLALFIRVTLCINGVVALLTTPPPLRVIWNLPDRGCRKNEIDFNLDDYGIEDNKNDFIGDKVAVLYSSKFGKWPHVSAQGKWVNGGLPEHANMTDHLEALESAMANYDLANEDGFGVIDMELWRPIFLTNYGRMKMYRSIVKEEVLKIFPNLPRDELRQKADGIWNPAARKLMEESLKKAKSIWPKMKWGYYGYPEYVSRYRNNLADWLWQKCGAFYPSVYIKPQIMEEGLEAAENQVGDKLKEAFRVRKMYGRPEIPIMAYTMAQNPIVGMFPREWVEAAIRVPAEMGVDGLIIWGSSKLFSQPVKENCYKELKFIQKTLGPVVKKTIARLTRCSGQLCGGRGRCVRKEYAKKYKYLLDRYKQGSILQAEETRDEDNVEKEFLKDFVCQCYKGWAGELCSQKFRD